MKARTPLEQWQRIPARLRSSTRGLRAVELDRRGGEEGLSLRETIHHVVEANLIASNMIIAALATNGGKYDWTWVWPDRKWMRRVGYDKAEVGPAIDALRAMTKHVAALISAHRDGLKRTVQLQDSVDGPWYTVTIEGILDRELEHVQEHLDSSGLGARRRPG